MKMTKYRSLFDNTAFTMHMLYKRLFTYWKVKKTGQNFRESLNFDERVFFLGILPALKGDNLIFYDIGASSGIVSTCMAKICSVSEVHAFEPIPSVYKRLEENVKKFPYVYCHNVAIGDQNRDDYIYVNSSITSSSINNPLPMHKQEFPWTDTNTKVRIQIVKLDDYVNEKALPTPDVVKIDVQGYEEHVIKGGKNTILSTKYVIIEMSFVHLFEDSPLFDDIYHMLTSMGFTLIGFAGFINGTSGRQLQADGIFCKVR